MTPSVAPRSPRYIPPVTINVPFPLPPHDTIDLSLMEIALYAIYSTILSTRRVIPMKSASKRTRRSCRVLVDAQTPKILSGMEE
ncbi:hypothetical protein WG66_003876 [Moniliophthora roreri]|nr:hypothetical protein WG66_003876 [Moniliophthora roreri]